ncbi:unnamed protein product, partial [Pylaiella littoralis]
MREVQHHAETLRLLGAIERSARLSPRDRLELGLLPPTYGVDRLHKAAVASLTPADSHETIAFGIRCLSALGELCQELECSERLGLIGGHKTVLRLMTEGCVSSDARRHRGENSLDMMPPVEIFEQRCQPHDFCCGLDSAGTAASVDSTSGGGKIITAVGGGGVPAVDDDGEEQEGGEDEVQSAAALVAARVVSSGSSFPIRPSFPAGDGSSSGLGRFPLRYDFVVANSSSSSPSVNCTYTSSKTAATAVHDGTAIAAARVGLEEPSEGCSAAAIEDAASECVSREHPGGDASCGGESISILIRPVKERQHSQFDVGFVMWPAAVILSRLLCRHPETVRGRCVLEIGAGLGLAGLVAARIQQQTPSSAPPRFPPGELATADRSAAGSTSRAGLAAAASVTLSDFNPLVLRALEANVALNAGSGTCFAAKNGDADDHTEEVGESLGEFRQQSSETFIREGGRAPRRDVCVDAERQEVYVRHLDWDELKSGPDEGNCHSGPLDIDDGCDSEVPGQPAGVGASDNVERFTSGESNGNDNDFVPRLNSTGSRQQRGGVKGIEHGDHFDVIIASDHICQASDAEGTIRVLRAMLAEATLSPPPPPPSGEGGGGGHAHFVVAHPRTRWGVDALVPLLEQCPELSFTCEEVTDPDLVAGLEEASYLAWLHVHVWRRSPAAAAVAAGGVGG